MFPFAQDVSTRSCLGEIHSIGCGRADDRPLPEQLDVHGLWLSRSDRNLVKYLVDPPFALVIGRRGVEVIAGEADS